jgi:UDP-N-acetylglucosamine 2-epimerase (non-hydrolysing)
MKVMSVVGARPNFMKVAPIIAAINSHNEKVSGGKGNQSSPELISHTLVHTGQHYDQRMSDSFFADLNLAMPDVHLGVGSGSHAAQTAEIMRKFEEVLVREKPDVIVVVGDVNSTLACALVASKISFDSNGARPLVAHVEAGLRSFDRSMPEEINRILTDQLADLLFVTEEDAIHNLIREAIPASKIHFTGNTMIDSLLACKEKAGASIILHRLGLCASGNNNGSGESTIRYALLTLHRPANVDRRDAFLNILEGLEEAAKELPIIFPAHPRTQKRITEFGLDRRLDWRHMQHKGDGVGAPNGAAGVHITEPLGYLDFLWLMSNAALVVTDSGGIQEETTCLGVPCVTVRENTERPVTITVGTNILAGVCKDGIRAAIRRQLKSKTVGAVPELWDGKSAARILDVLNREVQGRISALPDSAVATSKIA